MAVKQRPQWTAVEIALHAMEATSLSQLTLPEVKRMAARILNDERNAVEPNKVNPKPAADPSLRQTLEEQFHEAWPEAQKFVD